MLISLLLVVMCKIKCQEGDRGGPKVGRLLPIYFNFSNVSFACNNVPRQYEN